MKKIIKDAVEEYQCSGCVCGSNISCFKSHGGGVGCGKHIAGTKIGYIGFIFLGLPTGFNRLGLITPDNFKPRIYEKYDEHYNKLNIPVWKYLNKEGHVLVRGLMPRINQPFIDIYLIDCMDEINCLEITNSNIEAMD